MIPLSANEVMAKLDQCYWEYHSHTSPWVRRTIKRIAHSKMMRRGRDTRTEPMASRKRLVYKGGNELIKKMEELLVSSPYDTKEVAKYAGVDVTTINEWRRGQHDPKLIIFDCVLRALGWRLTIVRDAPIAYEAPPLAATPPLPPLPPLAGAREPAQESTE